MKLGKVVSRRDRKGRCWVLIRIRVVGWWEAGRATAAEGEKGLSLGGVEQEVIGGERCERSG